MDSAGPTGIDSTASPRPNSTSRARKIAEGLAAQEPAEEVTVLVRSQVSDGIVILDQRPEGSHGDRTGAWA